MSSKFLNVIPVMCCALVVGSSVSMAGDLFGLRGGCNCQQSTPVMVQAAPVVDQPVYQMAPVLADVCECSAAVPACCGIGGGLGQIGNLYASSGVYGGFVNSGHMGGGYGSPAPGSFMSGFENLPNMDGGGIHHRYPYHSYRRPWAFPGTPSTNVTIAW